MIKYMTEVLGEINKDPDQIHKYMKDAAFSIIMQYAFDPEKKMKLPPGEPDYKQDLAPMGLSPTNLRYESKRLYVFTRGDLSQFKREVLFVQLLESLHPAEATILVAVKDQELHKLYPNINKRLISQFGFCPLEEEKAPVQVLPKSEEHVDEIVSHETEEPVEPKPAKGKPKKKSESP